jgi:nucleotide-binding universal stress UspA family protein
VNVDRVPAGAVVVVVDRSSAGRRALHWATAEARRTAVPLCAVTNAPGRSPSAERSPLATIGERLNALLALRGHPTHPEPDRVRALSAEAGVVVVPVTFPGLTELIATSYSPVVVVPERAAEDGPVVLGAAPWTGVEVYEAAFREAAQRRVGLIAVQTHDRATDRARQELDHALSPWTIIYPEVEVERVVEQEHATALLLDLSTRAQLLVLGRSSRGALLGLVVGSPAVDLLGAAHSPLLVVPAAGPPRSTWWPTASSRRARAGG